MNYQIIIVIGLALLAGSVVISLLLSICAAYGMNSDDHETRQGDQQP